MDSIEFIHNLDKDISNLENSYKAALNYIYALRVEKASILAAVSRNDIDIIKEMFVPDDIEKFRENSKDVNLILKDIESYSFGCDWAKIIDFQ